MELLQGLDYIRILSTLLSAATIVMIIMFWKHYPKYKPQFLLIIAYLLHGLLYYGLFLVDRVFNGVSINTAIYNDWGAFLRFHSYATWFFVALLYYTSHNRNGSVKKDDTG
jgi:hypothetical protein